MTQVPLLDGMYGYHVGTESELMVFARHGELFLPLCELVRTYMTLVGEENNKVFSQLRDAATYALRKQAKNGKYRKLLIPGYEKRMPVIAVCLGDAAIVLNVFVRRDKHAAGVIRGAVDTILDDKHAALRKRLRTVVVKAAAMRGLCAETKHTENSDGLLCFPLAPGRYLMQLGFAQVEFLVSDEHVVFCVAHMLNAIDVATRGKAKAYMRRQRRRKIKHSTVMHPFGTETQPHKLVAGWTLGYCTQLLYFACNYVRKTKGAELDRTQIEEIRAAVDRLDTKCSTILCQLQYKGPE